jgi:Cu-Zn family superoxide dismutase
MKGEVTAMLFQMGFQRERIAGAMKSKRPAAYAQILGGPQHRAIRGRVNLYSLGAGTLMEAAIFGLPHPDVGCPHDIFAFHIHEGERCAGTQGEPFQDTGGHYNPDRCLHPAHVGDMPPLFGNRGYAWMAFYTDRFAPGDVVGRTVVIHAGRDDFTSQPSGDAGAKIACGEIRSV